MAKFKRGDLVRLDSAFANGSGLRIVLNDKPWGQYWLVLSVRAFSWDFEVEGWEELTDIMEKQKRWQYGEDYNGHAEFTLTRICTGDEWQLDGNDQLLVKGVPYA